MSMENIQNPRLGSPLAHVLAKASAAASTLELEACAKAEAEVVANGDVRPGLPAA